MLPASRQRMLEQLHPNAVVLDVGGGANPFERADWVIDVLAYEERGLYGAARDRATERFSAETWIQRDICAREPWPFPDRRFDFSVCSHTLEDVRDPVFVCSELMRVSKAGYIEVPSRLEEQSVGFQGPWVGWGHHRWLIDADGDELTFVFKHHVIHGRARDHFPTRFHEALSPEQRVLAFWWEDRFRARERIFLDAASLDSYLAAFVAEHDPRDVGAARRRWRRA